MKAATFGGIERTVFREKPEPEIVEPTDAIVEVEIAGLCGSDLHPWSGRERGMDPGTTMGHELTGRVIAAGSDVRGFRPGDLVLSPFSTSCGVCGPCARGLSARCTRGALFGWISGGKGLEGAQAERVRVPLADGTLLRRPAGISAIEAILLGDVVSTGFFAVGRTASNRTAGDQEAVSRGGAVAVLGLGAVGLAAVLAARRAGAAVVVAVDAIEERLALAEAFGGTPVPLGGRSPSDIAAEARRLCGGEGCELVVDAVGSPDATRLAVQIVRPGGCISIVGVHTEEAFAVAPAAAYDRNLTIAIGRCPVRSRLEALVNAQLEERLPIERIVTHRFPLSEAADAYRLFADRRGGVIKAVFDPKA